jgi:glutamate--cysteine ligase
MKWDYAILNKFFVDDNEKKLLLDGSWGIEREGQRINADGSLALTRHPQAFGDKLTNARITTDFAESQLELVTPPYATIDAAYDSLLEIQKEVEQGLADELMWPLSMPPKLPDEEAIPIAYFGETPAGKEKEIYRQGLAKRYGKKMQMISGIHYNYSLGNKLSDFLYQSIGDNGSGITSRRQFDEEIYLAIVRNFLRYRWLLIYLFGASPNIDETYHSVICKELEEIKQDHPDCYQEISNFERYATSLRVSRYGYSNSVQQKYTILFNSLNEYITTVREMLQGNILQKENEFYSPIRLKPILEAGEVQLDVLDKRGIAYIEVRILDLNPFAKGGIDLEQLYFMQVFMLYCLFEGNADLSKQELEIANENHHLVAMAGRNQELKLKRFKKDTYKSVSLIDFGQDIFDKLIQIAIIMDEGTGTVKYQTVIKQEKAKLDSPDLLFSSRVCNEMLKNKESYLQFGIRYANLHKVQA